MSEENKAKALADLAIDLYNAAAGEWGASVEHGQCLKLALTQAGFGLPLFDKENMAVDKEGHTLHSLDSEESNPTFDHVWRGEYKNEAGDNCSLYRFGELTTEVEYLGDKNPFERISDDS